MALSEQQIIKALEAKSGFISAAAKSLGCRRQTLYNRISKSQKLKEVLDDIRESHLDLAEHALISKITKERDLGAICFYLKCQGKNRGYIEKQQVDMTQSEGPLVIVKESTK